MRNLTKYHILALFLGASSAQIQTITPIELLNGPSTEAGNADPENQALTTSMSGTACNGNADCTVSGEICGLFTVVDPRFGILTKPRNFCVAKKYCGSIGTIDIVPWELKCWTDSESES